jgi:hypothetical protein
MTVGWASCGCDFGARIAAPFLFDLVPRRLLDFEGELEDCTFRFLVPRLTLADVGGSADAVNGWGVYLSMQASKVVL